jgi:hypothetical protein
MFAYAKKPATKTVVVLSAAILAIGGPIATEAQDKTDERIRACGEIENATERMECFNALVESVNENPAEPDVPTVKDAPAAAATATKPAADSAAAATSATAISTTSPATEADDIGLEEPMAAEAEQQEKEEQKKSEPESVHSTITQSQKSGLNHFVVMLDNGQVWEETDGSRRIGLPKVGQPVEISKGRFGGYRMKIGDDNRVAWVRRLQ